MAMEITLEHDEVDDVIYTTTIRPVNQKPIIVDTLWHGKYKSGSDHSHVNSWISKIKRLQEKKKQKTLIISLFADRCAQYKNGGFSYYNCRNVSNAPFDVMQLCIDNHCLFYEFNRYSYEKKYILILSKLLYDNKTVVVGLGIEDVVKKLEKDFNIKVNKWVDLSEKAREKGIFGEIPKNCSVKKLAKKVLGDEWGDVNKPANMEWWNSEDEWFLSDEKVKFGTLESFLAYRIGTVLLKD